MHTHTQVQYVQRQMGLADGLSLLKRAVLRSHQIEEQNGCHWCETTLCEWVIEVCTSRAVFIKTSVPP